jgi:uncharacterized phage infection (PIP) family protein YhgE
MQSWPIIQPSIIIKGRIKKAIYILDLVTILIARLISSLQATVTTIIYSAAFPTIKNRIRPTKVVETVPFTIISLMLSTINLKQKAINIVKNLRVIIAPQIVN